MDIKQLNKVTEYVTKIGVAFSKMVDARAIPSPSSYHY